jgi:hypothetical protein
MLQSEWSERTGHQPTPEEWELIHTVYAWHPAIPEVKGKEVIARLFQIGGIGVLQDMLLKARRVQELEDAFSQVQQELGNLKQEEETLKAEIERRRAEVFQRQSSIVHEQNRHRAEHRPAGCGQ